jgi:cytochrome c peroxidase
MRLGAVRSWQVALGCASVFVACQHDEPSETGRVDGPSGGVADAGQAGEPSAGATGGTRPTMTDGGSQGVPAGQAGQAAGGLSGEGGIAASSGEAGAAGATGAAGAAQRLPDPPYPPSPYPAENPDSDPKALLGKILFWDEQMGGDNPMACGTCHRPNAGGSDPRSQLPAAAQAGADQVVGTADDIHGSPGVLRCNALGEHTGQSVQVTTRKAPTYLDAMFAGRLFWDGRAECSHAGCPSFSAFEDPDQPGTFPIQSGGALENQAVGPPLSDVEMACEGASWPAIHVKLASATPLALAKQIPTALASFITAHDASYPKLFQAAFGSAQTSGPQDEINTRRIAFALATHERRLRSDQTPWDVWNAGDDSALTPAQQRGVDVFSNKARCSLCHRAPAFTDGDFHFIGFHEPSWDLGRKSINTAFGVPGAMRTPTLRNVGLREATGLLHNGAGHGATLAQIIDLYDLGGLVDNAAVKATPIDTTILPLLLTPGEKADLLDFLQHGLDDPRVKAQTAPFDRPLLSTE